MEQSVLEATVSSQGRGEWSPTRRGGGVEATSGMLSLLPTTPQIVVAEPVLFSLDHFLLIFNSLLLKGKKNNH